MFFPESVHFPSESSRVLMVSGCTRICLISSRMAVTLACLVWHEIEPFLRSEANFISFFGQAQVGVVLPKNGSVFGAGRKHAIRFFRPLRNQVINQHANVGFGTLQREFAEFLCGIVGVDSGHQTLAGGFFITGCFR